MAATHLSELQHAHATYIMRKVSDESKKKSVQCGILGNSSEACGGILEVRHLQREAEHGGRRALRREREECAQLARPKQLALQSKVVRRCE